MIWDIYLSHPTFLIAPTLGAVAGCVFGYYAALRNRWQTSSVLLVAFLILLSMIVTWLDGVGLMAYKSMDYKSGVIADAFGLSAPTALPFLVSQIYLAGQRKASARMLLSLEAAAGLLGVLVYPIWAMLCGYFVWLLSFP
jgi:hypothetical protein